MLKVLLTLCMCMFFFSSCDVKPELSAISKISTSFNTGNLTFPGGLIIYGTRTDQPGKVTFTFSNGIATPITMDRGDWTFYAFGYSGDVDSDGDFDLLSVDDRFAGTLSCGTGNASFRGGRSGSVDIEITPAGCAGKLARTLNFKTIQARMCSANYDYTKATKTFSTPAVFNPSITCAMPLDQDADIFFYKVSALDVQNSASTKSFSSKCQQIAIGSNYLLPTGEVPLNFAFYRSKALCDSALPAHVEYALINGMTVGSPTEFDHRLDAINAAVSRVNFPSAHTKRFTSPFMNNIPRILCESNNDCFNLPVQEYMAEVPWTRPLKNQLLMRDAPVNSCEGLKYNSKYFGISDCEIRNRSVYGTVSRNQITCRDSTFIHPIYKDIYARKDRIYILSHNGTNSTISILNKGGSVIQQVTSPSLNTTYESVAASDAGDLFVTSPTAGTHVLTMDTNGTYSVTRSFPGLLGKKIEVDDSGNLMYFVKSVSPNTVYVVNSFDASETDSLAFTGTVLKIQKYKSTIHVLDSSPTADPAPFRTTLGTINTVSVDTTTGDMLSTTSLPAGYGLLSFHIDNSNILNTYTHPDGPGAIFRYELNASGAWVIRNGFGGAGLNSNSDKIIVSDEVAIGIQTNSQNLYGIRWNSNGVWVPSLADDSCEESFEIMLSGHTINFSMRTERISTSAQLNPPLWEAALKFAGRNHLGLVVEGSYPVNQYFYEVLNEEQVITTTGGKLNTAMKLLGPHGVGGMLHEYGTCSELKSILDVSPVAISKSFAVNNPYTGFRSYQITVSKTVEAIDPFNCTANSILPDFACPNKYDLLINVASTGLLEKENYQIKLNCSVDAGELNYLKNNSLETRKEFSLWNTEDLTAARVDSSKSIQRGDYFKGEMSVVSKYAVDSLWAREILVERKTDEYFTKETEYSRQGTYHMTDKVEFEGNLALAPAIILDNTDLTSGEICLDFNETNINTLTSGPSASCTMTQKFNSNFKGHPLTIRQMQSSHLPGSDFQNMFSISP